ncbi:hypothetical protein C809_01976 [Lachnospiraceae bacterium MD335]|jgi:teichoic acid transport system permease protein|nr:hypothetical protein C809_01976 [Lachnospiraceae bacterium MD335]
MRFFKELKQYWGFAVYSAKCDLKAEVANSYLNWLWWILEPFCTMIIYALVFGVAFKTDVAYFPIFILIGIMMWDFFNRLVMTSVEMIRGNQHIISRVYMPKYILVLQRMLVLAFKMMINLGIIIVMLIFFRVPVGINILFVFPILFVYFIFCFGCSLIIMHFGVYVSDLTNALGIILNFVYFLTGIFYNVQDSFPAPYGYLLQRINPVAHLLFCIRKALLYNETPSCIMLSIWFVISIILSAIGLKLIYENENDYVKMV